MASEDSVAESFCAVTLLSRHVIETKTLIEAAVEEVCQNFEDTARLSQRNFERTTSFLGQDAAGGAGREEANLESLIVNSEKVLHHLLDRLADACDKSRSATQRLNQIDACLNGVAFTMSQISEITISNRILAVNARIQAAQFGEQGHGFGVVANEISAQAKRSTEFANTIAGMLEQLRRAVDLSRQDLLESSSHDRIAMEESKQEVVRAHADFRRFLDRTQRFLNETAADSRRLTGDIHNSVRGLQFQDRASQRLQFIANELDALSQGISGDRRLSPDAISASETVRDMMSRTSMLDQREALAVSLALGPGEVELF